MSGSPFIVVEGPIGVGKTTLARRLADTLGADLLLEEAERNPFLERFYRNPREAALSTQLHFLLQRSEQLRDLGQDDLFRGPRVADFLLDKDRLFAEANLDADEFALYSELYRHLAVTAPVPDLVVYLQASVTTLIERVERRGIGYEQGMDPDYLERLAEAYTRLFHTFDRAPLLIVNAEAVNFADNDADYAALVEEIHRTRSGRHFFNPVPLAVSSR